MAALLWPIAALPPRGLTFDIAPRNLAGPSSISGFTQVVSSDAGIWKATYDSVPVLNENGVLCWRGINNLLEGRLTPILVPLTRRYQPIPAGQDDLYESVPHDDDSPFDDASEYQGQVIDVTLSGDVAKRAVSASITIDNAATIQPGQHFSLGERLYRVRTITYSSDTAATITFRPPAREAASTGDRLEFDFPVCRMRLASDDQMDLPLDYNFWGFPSVNFIEDV